MLQYFCVKLINFTQIKEQINKNQAKLYYKLFTKR